MRNLIWYSVLIIILGSCREDEPVPDFHIMRGNWSWLYTNRYNGCAGGVTTIDPVSQDKSILLEFTAANSIKIFENNVFIREEPIKFKTFEYPNGQGIVPSNDLIETTFNQMNSNVLIKARGTLKELKINNLVNEKEPCYDFGEVYRKL